MIKNSKTGENSALKNGVELLTLLFVFMCEFAIHGNWLN